MADKSRCSALSERVALPKRACHNHSGIFFVKCKDVTAKESILSWTLALRDFSADSDSGQATTRSAAPERWQKTNSIEGRLMAYIAGKFVVALWTCSTSHNPVHRQKTVADKFHKLEIMVKACQEAVGRANIAFGANGLPFTVSLGVASLWRRQLEEKIFALSKRFPGIVIVPGSIFYWKSAMRPLGHVKLSNTGQSYQTENVKDRRIGAVTKLNAEYKPVAEKQGARGRTEFFNYKKVYDSFSPGTNADSAFRPSVNEKKDSLENANIKILRNSTGVYLGGTRYGKYDKQQDCFETFRPNEMAFIGGTKDECPKIGECRFGLEICVDHDSGCLRKRNVSDLHFHIVVSDWVKTKTDYMAMCTGGYFLHASSNHIETKLAYKDLNGTVHERPKQDLLPGHTEKISFYTEDWTWGTRPPRPMVLGGHRA